MFGQHFLGHKDAVLQLALRHHALAFLEQVGQDALKVHRHALGRVGHHEVHCHAGALDATGHHQTAQTEGAVDRRLFGLDLCGGEKEHQIALEGVQDQRGSRRNHQNHAGRNGQPFMTRFHVV